VPVSRLGEDDAREMFGLLSRHYEHVDRARFEADLAEKDYAILLREAGTAAVRGFSTQQILRVRARGAPVVAIFSGDTIIDRAFWGEQALVRAWGRFAGALAAETRPAPLFWFLISKGYRTYLYLPLFFERYFPRLDAPMPPFERDVLDALALAKFPGSYRRTAGLLEFADRRGNLTPELAAVPTARLRDARVRFFLERNPDYAQGVELCCLAEISRANMRSVAARAFAEGAALGGVEALLETEAPGPRSPAAAPARGDAPPEPRSRRALVIS
jgi:hypothetical protein